MTHNDRDHRTLELDTIAAGYSADLKMGRLDAYGRSARRLSVAGDAQAAVDASGLAGCVGSRSIGQPPDLRNSRVVAPEAREAPAGLGHIGGIVVPPGKHGLHRRAPQRGHHAQEERDDVARRQARRSGSHPESVVGRARTQVMLLVKADVERHPSLESAILFPCEGLIATGDERVVGQTPVLHVRHQLHPEGASGSAEEIEERSGRTGHRKEVRGGRERRRMRDHRVPGRAAGAPTPRGAQYVMHVVDRNASQSSNCKRPRRLRPTWPLGEFDLAWARVVQ